MSRYIVEWICTLYKITCLCSLWSSRPLNETKSLCVTLVTSHWACGTKRSYSIKLIHKIASIYVLITAFCDNMNALIHIIHCCVSVMLYFQVRPDIWLFRLQRNQTLLHCLWLRGIDSCCVCREDAFCRWSWGWVTGACATGFVGLVCWVVDKAVRSRLAAALNNEGQLCRGQRPGNTIYIHTECVRGWRREIMLLGDATAIIYY